MTDNLRQAAQQAMEALEAILALNDNYSPFGGEIQRDRIDRSWDNARAAIAAIRNALAEQPEQKPVEYQHRKPIMDSQGNTIGYSDWLPGKGLEWWPHRELYTAPQQREWQGLTKDERYEAVRSLYANDNLAEIAAARSDDEYKAIEAKLKEKNT